MNKLLAAAVCGAVIAGTVSAQNTQNTQREKTALIVYFSWSGNIARIADEIRTQTNADIFRLQPQTPYTQNYNELLAIAGNEQRSAARPAIQQTIPDFDSYDVVFIGFPNWWSDMPMIMYTFFENYDMSGKTIAPFCSSGGSGFSDMIGSIKKQEPEAGVTEGLHIRSADASRPQKAVTDWLKKLQP